MTPSVKIVNVRLVDSSGVKALGAKMDERRTWMVLSVVSVQGLLMAISVTVTESASLRAV